MPRRDISILEDLAKLPWWVSVCLSAGAFVGLRFVVPLFTPAGPTNSSNFAIKGLLAGASAAAPFVALVLLIPAAIAAAREWSERRLLDTQKDLASIRALSWRRFEALVAEAYRRQGYAVHGNTGDGPDGGVDLTLKKDGNLILVQCKQWKAWKVGVKVVREIFGVMTARRAQGAIIVTSGIFTQEARTFAAGKPIDLVGGHQLAELIGVVQRSSAHTSRPVQPSNLVTPKATPPTSTHLLGAPKDSPPPTQPELAPKKTCPKCGAEMVLRTAQRGAQAGQQFWGCSSFPACRVTEDVKSGD